MNEKDREPILAIALMAALADGQATAEEKARLQSVGTRLGIADMDTLAGRVAMGALPLAEVAARLSDDEARRTAYEMAVTVCNSDGTASAQETRFLMELRPLLGLDAAAAAATQAEAAAIAGAPVAGPAVGTGTPASPAGLDELIQKQAIITGALELLPDRLANVAIIPLQLRLVYQIGQAHGQQMDASQVKDLAGALGIGAAAQVAESAVRKLLGGLAGGLLGRALGGTTGLAAGAAVSFASTYALGHVAKQYYAQGRNLSGDDLKALFTRFQAEAKALFPKLEQQIQAQAQTVNVKQLLGLRG
jgi:uncharacterized protein (DUF697 family)/tellurite resistance protein